MTEHKPDTGDSMTSRCAARTPLSGWLQVLGSERPGRTIRLDKPVTRFGRAGSMAAMISRRDDGYYLCHLEGDEYPRVNQVAIDEQACPLNGGDRIWMGGLEFRFFLEPRREPLAEDTAQIAPAARQRHYSRISLHTPALITGKDRQWGTRLIDISLSGALLEHPIGWAGSTGEQYTLGVPQDGGQAVELGIEIRQVRAGRLGVAFRDLDEARRQRLRSLVAINVGERDPLRQELSERA